MPDRLTSPETTGPTQARPIVTAIDPSIRQEAAAFLKAGLSELRRQRAIPHPPSQLRWTRWDGPWPAKWACTEVAESEMAAPLIAALRTAYSDRFGEETPFTYKNPREYAAAYLRAVVAHSLVRHGRVRAKSGIASEMLEELHAVISRPERMCASIWLLDDVDFSAVRDEQVDDVRITPPTSPPERLVSDLLPEALWADDRGYPSPGAKHAGLMYATGFAAKHHLETTLAFNRSLDRCLKALRLATATTAPVEMVWMGETSAIHIDTPEAHPQQEGFLRSYWRRLGTVTPDVLSGLRRLNRLLVQLETLPKNRKKAQRAQKGVPPVVIAIGRHARSLRATAWQDAVLDLATALEACFGPRNKAQEIGLSIRTRAAHLLTEEPEEAETIYTDITDLYNLRSDIIHGNPTLTKDLAQLWAERGYDQVLEEDRMQLLLDRWRDIVRRAISARLMLGDPSLNGGPLWPLSGDEPAVDRALVRRDRRDEWRGQIVEGARSYRLPLLAGPAPALIDFLHPAESTT